MQEISPVIMLLIAAAIGLFTYWLKLFSARGVDHSVQLGRIETTQNAQIHLIKVLDERQRIQGEDLACLRGKFAQKEKDA